MRRLGFMVVLVGVAGLVGCGGGGGGGAPGAATGAAVTRPAPAPAPSEPEPEPTAVVHLSSPRPDAVVRAVRGANGALRASIDVRGSAVGSQTLRVQLSCPSRSCSRFVLTAANGDFAVRMRVPLPRRLSRLTVAVDYATTPSAQTAATVKVSVHRPPPARRAPSPGRSSTPSPESEPSEPSPTTTLPETPAPDPSSDQRTPAGSRRTLTVIGDSLAVGMKPYLPSLLPGWTVTVDGRVGRPLAEGMGLVRAADLPSPGASVLAISLFTNDDPRGTAQLSAAVDETLRRVGADGCVIWATIARDPVGGVSYAAANALLARKAAASANLRIADWAGYVDAHPGTLSAGNVHPGPSGYQARAGLYAQAAAGCP